LLIAASRLPLLVMQSARFPGQFTMPSPEACHLPISVDAKVAEEKWDGTDPAPALKRMH
jgi:hypothetical protein